MKNILIINTVGFQYDGITSVIMNYCKGMDRTGLAFTFPVYEDIHPSIKADLEKMGNTILFPDRKASTVSYINALIRLRAKKFDVIHIHGNSGTMCIETAAAKWMGIKKIIVHTHSTNTNHPFFNAILKYPMLCQANMLLACSDAAGKWLYGNRPYVVLNNAIQLDTFRFNFQTREHYRQELGIDHEFLVGHAGHFSPVKNHTFLIDAFEAFQKLEPNSKLLLIGTGSLLEQIQAYVKSKQLSHSVIFLGSRCDIASLYSAIDLFVLPSVQEGLSLVSVEAQASSLPILVSTGVPADVNCTELIRYKSLSDGAESWAEAMQEMKRIPSDRAQNQCVCIARKGFDIFQESEKLRKIYQEG